MYKFKPLLVGLLCIICGGVAQAGSSFSISVPVVTPYTPMPVPVTPQMCWNGYFHSWQPCGYSYSPPPVVYYQTTPYAYYPQVRHHHYPYHSHSGRSVGFSFSYRSR